MPSTVHQPEEGHQQRHLAECLASTSLINETVFGTVFLREFQSGVGLQWSPLLDQVSSEVVTCTCYLGAGLTMPLRYLPWPRVELKSDEGGLVN